MTDSIQIKLNTVEKIERFNLDSMKFDCDINVSKDKIMIDAKSIMGLMGMDFSRPVTAQIMSEDEKVCNLFLVTMQKYAN